MLLAWLALSAWEIVLDNGTTRVEKRLLPSGLLEMKATTSTDLAPQIVADAFWFRQAVKGVRKYVLIKRTDREKIIYVQLKLPVIKDRDYTVRMSRYEDAKNGLFQFDTACDSTAGPEVNPDFIRVTFCIGHLTVERDEDGRTLVTNVSAADPAGAVPSWMVNLLAPKAAGNFIEELVAESKARRAL